MLIFGPTAYPVMFTVMPVMMVLGWRHGLLGAGLGALVTIVLSLGLSLLDAGIVSKLRGMGYDAAFRGSFLELFFIIAILSSLPLAILRARQRVTDTKLAEALGAAELRAEQLAVERSRRLAGPAGTGPGDRDLDRHHLHARHRRALHQDQRELLPDLGLAARGIARPSLVRFHP